MRNFNKVSKISLALAGLIGTVQSHAVVTDIAFFRALPMVIVWGADAPAETSVTPNPVASDLVLLGGTSGTVGSDIITGNVFPVVTGTLTPASQAPVGVVGSLVGINNPTASPTFSGLLDNDSNGMLNATDSLSKFGVQASTSVGFANNTLRRSFYVASNAGFDIFAQSGAVTSTGDFSALNASNINWSMAITVSGTDGGLSFGTNAQNPTTGGTGIATATTLNTFTSPTKVFDGGRKTAASNGGLAAQSVRFDVTYGMVGGYNLSLGTGSISVPVTYTIYNP